ncbi:OLC1v1019819C1 [Oldenlandia corymbosa var. corymbosa]|uniref:OLC1v1019819C1 n=1 Tax=Oldenlandia corymbosa var. corymbosa TaxID=529605 RepID=A0AAV1EFC7_OLDCO|nr:OLC1v1019819C1 [Oldenlandia corymbosa var. corymbosa]
MNRKFGGGKQPTGTPSLAWSCAVVVVSLLAGASVVHNIFKPNLTLPPIDNNGADEASQREPNKKQ